MSEFPLTPYKKSPSIAEVGGDVTSHTRVLQAVRELVMVGARQTGDLQQSFVRVSELVSLGVAEIQGGKLVVRVPINPPAMTTAARNALVNPQNGMMIYNSTTGKFQGRAAGAWVDFH